MQMTRSRLSPGMRRVLTSPTSLIIIAFLAWLAWSAGVPMLRWLIVDADFNGLTAADCTSGGACWVFIKVHFNRFMFGDYPGAEQWRVLVGFAAPALLGIVVYRVKVLPKRALMGAILLVVGPLFTLAMLHGGFAGLSFVPANRWGGLMVTLVVGGIGILLSLPLGIILALGRRSSMPLIRVFCVVYVEVWRGLPLLGVLFMGTLLLPLLLPAGTSAPMFYGVMAGIVLYAAAYLAEVVRGGLLSITKLQYEAADALGFSYWGKVRMIILPQALSNVLPAMVSVFIALFKSSTLVLVVGVFDLLGIVQNAAQNPDWAGFFTEGYVFVGLVFWVICYSVSAFGQSLENGRNRRNRDV